MLAVSVSSFALLQSLIVPVLATIEHELDTDQATVTWVLTAYLLSASIATPLLGRVGDVVGKTRMLVITLCALAVGSLMAALAPSIGWLIVARVVQGAGGGVLPLSFGIVRDEFGEKMTGALSVLASLTAVGFGLGIVIAGPIVDVFGYTGLFWLADARHLAGRDRRPAADPRVADPYAGPVAAAARRTPRGLAGRAAARAQRGQRVGLDLTPGPRPVRRRGGRGWRPGSSSRPGCRCR